jgi:hypothetical protein
VSGPDPRFCWFVPGESVAKTKTLFALANGRMKDA